MTVDILIAPAAAGKTAYLLGLVRDAAAKLEATPRVVVPGYQQTRAWRRRLAEAGGAIGPRVMTFDRLYSECLSAAGEAYIELAEPVQHRLLRAVIDDLPLVHYAPLADRPGLLQLLHGLIGELKAGMIRPTAFASAVTELGNEPRLAELADIYVAYQARLQARGWTDRAGLGWLAVEALSKRAPDVARDWSLMVVDGFDQLKAVQLGFLSILAGRVGQMVVTLTGSDSGDDRDLVHRRFQRSRDQLEAALDVEARPLPRKVSQHAPALVHLEANLFKSVHADHCSTGAVDLIEAPSREGEVREALRWLKARLVTDQMRPDELALLARSITPYRAHILQIAAEFGLPVRMIDGLPLRTNPAVAALLDLLRLVLPKSQENPVFRLPRRSVVEAWRSPYFDWSALPSKSHTEPIGIVPDDADALDLVARWGRVIGGGDQWDQVLSSLAAKNQDDDASAAEDDDRGSQSDLPRGAAARAICLKFERFVLRLTPPAGKASYRRFVGWLEALIGPDPELSNTAPEPTALQIVSRARHAPEEEAERDVAALQALKDVLRGLVWAEEALGTQPVDYPRFLSELIGAVEAASYRLPVRPDRGEILVADVELARGVPFRAAAVVGLAEGEFPTTLTEDPLLRDSDREQMHRVSNLPLESSTDSAEAQLFYEAATRPRDRLLLTRPRLADNGAPWQASPFWEEARNLLGVRPVLQTSESVPTPDQVASWPELMESLAAHSGYTSARAWARQECPERHTGVDAAAGILRLRQSDTYTVSTMGHFDGDLGRLADLFLQENGPGSKWSASRLESYRTCPFAYFIGSVLGLEPREEPVEGLDGRQLGNIYHHILEGLYQAPNVTDPADTDQLLAALDEVSGGILDAAPAEEGFRETAWWDQTRAEIIENVRSSVLALAELPGAYVPYRFEAVFGLWGRPPLVIVDGDDSLQLRGFIDRIDRDPDGRLRIIDYKTGGPTPFTNRAVAEGKKLQLPLYALAARDALMLGEPAEGFYWHVRQAVHSGFTLAGFQGGSERALETAVDHAWEAVQGVRAGHFVPHPPPEGCPSYCAAAGFCWHYSEGYWGRP